MSLTGGYDFCVELDIEVIRELFHIAFKQEDRFPHNFGPVEETYAVPGGDPLHATVYVRVYDEEDRAAELRFTDVTEMTFTFPMDLEVHLEEAPNEELSSMVLQAVIEAPGELMALPDSEADGSLALGLDFSGVAPGDVTVLSFSGLPDVDSSALTDAMHEAYVDGEFPHQETQGEFTLTVYDGSRDPSLNPPNSTGAEITATLQAGDWVALVFPIHVGGESSGYVLDTYGTVTMHRRLERTDEAFILHVNEIPPAGDAAHQTTVALDAIPGVDSAVFEQAVHDAYAAQVLPHVTPAGAASTETRVQFYDGTVDTSLVPPHPTSAEITAGLEADGGTTWLHIQIPCYAYNSVYDLGSPGVLHIHRKVIFGATTIEVDFADVPSSVTDPGRETRFEMDISAMDAFLGVYTGMIDAALAAVAPGPQPNPAAAVQQTIADGFDQFSVALGPVIQAAPSDTRAQELLREHIAGYLSQQSFPVYTPDPGENDVTVGTPVGKLLVADELLAVQLNRRAGTTEELPENFIDGGRLALAAGEEFIMEKVDAELHERFPGLFDGSGRDRIEEVTNRKVWLTSINVTLGEGQFNVSGGAEVEICCWWDPDVTFSGPVFLEVTVTETEDGCLMEAQAVPGEFDVSQSTCDIMLQIFIPIVGWIVGAVIASTISATKDGIIAAVAESVDEPVEAIPPVVFGIAEVRTCLTDIRITSRGIVFPGTVEVNRLDLSFEDLEDDNRLPDGGDS